jgi:hypothetical protein
MPCCVCGTWPVEVHHITGAGMALRASHFDTIPLCPTHHRLGSYGVAVHAGQKEWERQFGAQRELLCLTLLRPSLDGRFECGRAIPDSE